MLITFKVLIPSLSDRLEPPIVASFNCKELLLLTRNILINRASKDWIDI